MSLTTLVKVAGWSVRGMLEGSPLAGTLAAAWAKTAIGAAVIGCAGSSNTNWPVVPRLTDICSRNWLPLKT